MATTITFNGTSYSVPAYGDAGWAQGAGNLSSYLIAIAAGSLQTTGGTFTLSAPVNFGTAYGIVVANVSTPRETYTAGTASGTYTGSLTIVDLANPYVTNGKSLNVYINGLLQDVTLDYTETSTTRFTFLTNLNTGDRISVRLG